MKEGTREKSQQPGDGGDLSAYKQESGGRKEKRATDGGVVEIFQRNTKTKSIGRVSVVSYGVFIGRT